MNKRWIYILVALIVIVGGIYIVTQNTETKDPELSQEEVVPEDIEEVEDEDEAEADEEESDEEELPDDEIKQEEMPDNDGPQDDTEFAEIEIGKKLPDFKLENLDGEEVTLRELEGKIVLINFWATWCPYCVEEMPDLQKLKEENDDLVVIAVNVDEPKKAVVEYIDEGGYDFEVLLDEEGKVFAEYLGTGLPASYFLDEDGIFLGNVPGAISYEQMNEILGDIREM